jgi:hypothetical protein
LICLLYFAGVLVGAPLAGSALTPWFLALWSAVFVCGYVRFTRGRPMPALIVVMIVTVFVPVFALVALVWPIYSSYSALLASLWTEFRERGAFGGFALFVPLIVASILAYRVDSTDRLSSRRRSSAPRSAS